MRVAYLINQYPKISHSFIRREILALERQGIEVVRIAFRGWEAEIIDREDEVERARTLYVLRAGILVLLFATLRMLLIRPIYFLQAFALAWRMGWRADRPLALHMAYLAEACRVEPWLRSLGVQHQHAHFGTNPAEVAMLVHVLGGPPWSFTVHGPEEFDKWEFIGLGEKIRRCAFVVAISSYCRSQLYRCVGHRHWSKIQVVHCGVDSAFYVVPPQPVPNVRRLVCVGRLCDQKGQLLLVKAAQHLMQRGIDFELVLVGDGELRSELEASIVRHGLSNRVRITGAISTEKLRGELLCARALILPSFAEGLPAVIMEAMALRRPVISTYVAGIPELVRPGIDGWLIPAGELNALADAMRECLDLSTDALAHMGESGHRRVLERHDLGIGAKRLSALFYEIADPALKKTDVEVAAPTNW